MGNVKAVLEDIVGHGNDQVLFPGQIEAGNAKRSEECDGLLFTKAEMDEFAHIAAEAEMELDIASLEQVEA